MVSRKILLLVFVFMSVKLISAQNIISVSDTAIKTNELFWSHIKLENTDTIIAFQFDIVIPSSIEYKDTFSISDRFHDHSVLVKKIDDSRIKVLCFSPTNKSITGSNGAILNIQFNSKSDQGKFMIKIENPVMVGNSSKNLSDSVVNGEVTISGISNIKSDKSELLNEREMLFPNPFNNSTNVKYFVESYDPIKVSMYNIIGKWVFEKSFYPIATGWNRIFLQLSNLSSGLYVLRLIQKKRVMDMKALLIK